MGLSIELVTVQLCIRIFLCAILWSAAISKLAHPRQFRRAIQDYQVIPFLLEKRLSFSAWLSVSIPAGEVIAGCGLMSGILLIPSAVLTIALLLVFSAAIAVNLVQGRTELSCHCAGTLGNHQISLWLVGRNLLLMAMTSVLFLITPDQLTLVRFLREPALLHETFLTTIVPVVLVVGVILLMLWLFRYARGIVRRER